jgi:hypothetical protein
MAQTPTSERVLRCRRIKGLSVQWLQSIENSRPFLPKISRIKPFPLIRGHRAYGQAETAVRDLEIAGIVGEEAEVISDTDRDARASVLNGTVLLLPV